MRHSSYVLTRIHQQKADRLERRAHIHRLLEGADRPSLRTRAARWLVAVARCIDSDVATTRNATPPFPSRP